MAKNQNKIDKGGDSEAEKVVVVKKSNIFTNILLCVLIAAVGVVAYLLLTADKESEIINDRTVIGGRGIVATPDNIDQILAEREDHSDNSYSASMSVEWKFDSWDKPSDAYVENSTDNTRTVYFDLVLDQTEEVIFSSPFIPVGAKLENFALDKEVPAGNYTATVIYYLVDDDFEVITDVSVMVWLEILN